MSKCEYFCQSKYIILLNKIPCEKTVFGYIKQWSVYTIERLFISPIEIFFVSITCRVVAGITSYWRTHWSIGGIRVIGGITSRVVGGITS